MSAKDLRQQILLLREDLNGNKPHFKGLRYLRYLAVLLYAMMSDLFAEDGKKEEDGIYFNRYTLEKIAEKIPLNFDRTRSAVTVYEDAIQKGQIKKIRNDRGTEYYVLTESGIEYCITKLNQLEELHTSPLLSEVIKEKGTRMHYVTPDQIENVFKPKSYDPEVKRLLEILDEISRYDLDVD